MLLVTEIAPGINDLKYSRVEMLKTNYPTTTSV